MKVDNIKPLVDRFVIPDLHRVFVPASGRLLDWGAPLARPATKAPVTALYLRGRRCTAAPNAQNRPTTHVPQPLLHLVRLVCASRAPYGLSGWRC